MTHARLAATAVLCALCACATPPDRPLDETKHLDAPVHFAEGMSATADIPLRRLVGPARVIDVRAACRRDAEASF